MIVSLLSWFSIYSVLINFKCMCIASRLNPVGRNGYGGRVCDASTNYWSVFFSWYYSVDNALVL